MTDHADHDPDEIDFVVGSSAGETPDELLDTAPPRHTDRRLLVTLAVAALAVVGLVVALRGSTAPHPTLTSPSMSTRSDSVSVAPASPVLPTYGNDPVPRNTIRYTVVSLDANLCVSGRNCFRVATPTGARTKIRAAIRHAFGGVTRLRIRNSAIALDDPPRKSLFARDITATTPHGRLYILMAAVARNSVLTIPVPGNAISIPGSNGDYVVRGRFTTRRDVYPAPYTHRLSVVMADARLAARS